MMKEEMVNKAYALAKERYAEIGVDTEKVLEQMQDFHLSLHCWQADDVKGFEVQAGAMSGGIQSTGDFPGAARNILVILHGIMRYTAHKAPVITNTRIRPQIMDSGLTSLV